MMILLGNSTDNEGVKFEYEKIIDFYYKANYIVYKYIIKFFLLNIYAIYLCTV